jgi:UDP-2-acetamido-3-amino-2,3-dideoxy-glucuronate N-acetyltransferase
MASWFLHPSGICETAQVGSGTRIWAFTHVLPGAVIGEDCNICDQVFIEGDVVIGDRVTVKSGVQLWDGVRLEDDVFVGPNASFTNDRLPRSRQWHAVVPVTRVCAGASIGANATLLPGIVVGRNAMVGAGAVVTRDVPANAIVVGNPARISGYVDADRGREAEDVSPRPVTESLRLPGGACIVRLRTAEDLRGRLAALEFGHEPPFMPARVFVVFDVPTSEVRGEHAHRACHQLLVCVAGSLRALVDDGETRAEVRLDDPGVALYIPPMVWGTQFGYSQDTVAIVLASHPYDPDDYIRDYDEFLGLAARRRAAP